MDYGNGRHCDDTAMTQTSGRARVAVHDTAYYDISVDPTRGATVWLVWKRATAQMPQEEFQRALLELSETVAHRKPRSLTIDTREFGFAMTDVLRAWRDENITPRYNAAGLKRCAYIVRLQPGKVLPRPYTGAGFATAFFSDVQEAQVWLQEDS